jgi:Putative peptidoglycan binding domain.
MKKFITLAILGALAASPALARGLGEQHSEAQGIQSGQSAQMDQNTVRQIQEQLQSHGYDVGQVDGIWGPQSQQALANFQRDQNIQASGSPDQETLAALGVESDAQQAQTPDESSAQKPPLGGIVE